MLIQKNRGTVGGLMILFSGTAVGLRPLHSDGVCPVSVGASFRLLSLPATRFGYPFVEEGND